MRIAILTRCYTTPVLDLLAKLTGDGLQMQCVFVERALWGNPFRSSLRLIEKLLKTEGVFCAIGAICRQLFRMFLKSDDVEAAFREFARLHNIEVVEIDDFNADKARDAMRTRNVDVGIVFGTRKLSVATFSIPHYGCINIHHGSLPYYRGSESLFWAMYNNEEYAGVTVHRIAERLDTGDILATTSVRIKDYKYNQAVIQSKLFEAGNDLLCAVLKEGSLAGVPQDESRARYYSLPTKDERRSLDKRLKALRKACRE